MWKSRHLIARFRTSIVARSNGFGVLVSGPVP